MVHHCRLTLTAVLHQVGAKVYSSADPADPPDPPDQVSLSAARSLPSTRAGGQDDVSLNKLPQIIHVVEKEVRDPTQLLLAGIPTIIYVDCFFHAFL